MTTTPAVSAHLTDEALRANLTSESRGRRLEAEVLLTVPAEGRQAVWHDAWYSRNVIGGRLVPFLESAAAAYLRGDKLAGNVAPKLDPRRAGDPCPVCEDETSPGEPCDACWRDRIAP